MDLHKYIQLSRLCLAHILSSRQILGPMTLAAPLVIRKANECSGQAWGRPHLYFFGLGSEKRAKVRSSSPWSVNWSGNYLAHAYLISVQNTSRLVWTNHFLYYPYSKDHTNASHSNCGDLTQGPGHYTQPSVSQGLQTSLKAGARAFEEFWVHFTTQPKSPYKSENTHKPTVFKN